MNRSKPLRFARSADALVRLGNGYDCRDTASDDDERFVEDACGRFPSGGSFLMAAVAFETNFGTADGLQPLEVVAARLLDGEAAMEVEVGYADPYLTARYGHGDADVDRKVDSGDRSVVLARVVLSWGGGPGASFRVSPVAPPASDLRYLAALERSDDAAQRRYEEASTTAS